MQDNLAGAPDIQVQVHVQEEARTGERLWRAWRSEGRGGCGRGAVGHAYHAGWIVRGLPG